MSQDRDTEAQRTFEIQFFERILGHWAEFPEVMFRLGTLYTQTGRYEEGLEVDSRLARLRPSDPVVYYNLSCTLALLGRVPQALDALERAVDLGYRDVAHMEKDPDLAAIRGDERYARLRDRAAKEPGGARPP